MQKCLPTCPSQVCGAAQRSARHASNKAGVGLGVQAQKGQGMRTTQAKGAVRA